MRLLMLFLLVGSSALALEDQLNLKPYSLSDIHKNLGLPYGTRAEKTLSEKQVEGLQRIRDQLEREKSLYRKRHKQKLNQKEPEKDPSENGLGDGVGNGRPHDEWPYQWWEFLAIDEINGSGTLKVRLGF